MRRITLLFYLIPLIFWACNPSPVKKENRELVASINQKIARIDANHRVQIIEDDFHEGDSIYKLRAYYMDNYLVKVVSIMRTSNFEKDDYFYFDEHEPIFSGHLTNERDAHLAGEYKYYYRGGEIVESLFWEDHYIPGQRFPHEQFTEFEPNMDSLMEMERLRLQFCLMKLEMEGFEIRHLNEQLDANTTL